MFGNRFYISMSLCATILMLLSCNASLKPTSNQLSNRSLADSALLLAGSNRAELKKVISHYQNSGDSLKLEAAYYLIANMPGKYSYSAIGENPFKEHFDQLRKIPYDYGSGQLPGIKILIDSILQTSQLRTQRLYDLENITADYLINNIDQTFSQWEKCTWKDDYTFEEFCEWVLPYRTGTEELEAWRGIALDSKTPQEDSLLAAGDMFNLATNLLTHFEVSFNQYFEKYPFNLPLSDMLQLRRGTCGDQSRFTVQLFRSRGIPVSEDINIAWANRNSDHVWNSIILPSLCGLHSCVFLCGYMVGNDWICCFGSRNMGNNNRKLHWSWS